LILALILSYGHLVLGAKFFSRFLWLSDRALACLLGYSMAWMICVALLCLIGGSQLDFVIAALASSSSGASLFGKLGGEGRMIPKFAVAAAHAFVIFETERLLFPMDVEL
jgi:hypothetical protein